MKEPLFIKLDAVGISAGAAIRLRVLQKAVWLKMQVVNKLQNAEYGNEKKKKED